METLLIIAICTRVPIRLSIVKVVCYYISLHSFSHHCTRVSCIPYRMKIYQSYASDFNFTVQSRNDNNRLITWLTSSSHSLYTIVTSISVLLLSSRAVYIYIYIYNIYIFFFDYRNYYLLFTRVYLYLYLYIYLYTCRYLYVCLLYVYNVEVFRVSVLIARRVIELGRWASAVFRTFSIVIEPLRFPVFDKNSFRKNEPRSCKKSKEHLKTKEDLTALHNELASLAFLFPFLFFPFSLRFFFFPSPSHTLVLSSSTLLAPTLGFPPHDHRWWSSKNCSVQ